KQTLKTLLQDGVFQGLGRAQAHHGLCLDLDCFAGLRIAAHARLTMRLDHAPDSRNDELPGAALGFFHRQLVQLFEKESYLLLRCAEFVGDVRNNLGFAEWLGCHLVCLSSCNFFASRGTRGERGIFSSTPIWGEKTQAVWDYSEHATITQGQSPQKSSK